MTVRGFNLQEDFVDFHAHVGFDIAGNDDAVIGSNGGNYTTTGIVVERAADHTVIANSTAIGSFGDGIVVKGNGTDITNNIIAGNCWSGIHVEATATHTTIENNVVSNNGTVGEASHCTPLTGGPPVELGVYGAATSSTTEDYNTVDDEDVHIPLYAWKTPIATLAAYRIASGQGAHDIFTRNLSDDPGNPDYDSADSAAPGFQQTDSQGNPREDDPDSPNTGAGPITYADRGIYELDHGATVVPRTAVDRSTKTVTVDASDSTPGWSPIASYTFDFADGTKPVTQKSPVAHHTYRVRTTYEIKISVTSKDGFASNTYTDVQLGSDFVAVTPVRILDTRTGIGTGKNPLPAHFVQDIYPVGRSPIPSGVTGLLLDLTVLNGTKSGSLAAFDTDGPDVPVSNVHWKAGQTASNLVTVPVTDGGVGLRNSSSGRVDVIVDVVGYDTYAPGSFYHPAGPVRVLETKTPVQPHSSITLATAGNTALPASGVTSVLLSVTASNQKAAGSLTVYPDGTARPSISNVHWSLTQATTDLVVVPVINGKINFYNASSGTTDISADLIGYFATTPSVYSTDVPGVRVLDTRSTPVPAHTEVTLPTPVTPLLQTAGLAALILNVTVTSPTKSGNLVVYPDGQSRPAASNLSWSTGQTISDLVIVPVVNGKIHFYNNSSGTVAILADLEGSFGT